MHLLVDLKDCNNDLLCHVDVIQAFMLEAAVTAKATILGSHFHAFSPVGVSGVVIIAESHLSIHTWPEYNYAAVDIFTCGETLQPGVAAQFLIDRLQSAQPTIIEVPRGVFPLEALKPVPTPTGAPAANG